MNINIKLNDSSSDTQGFSNSLPSLHDLLNDNFMSYANRSTLQKVQEGDIIYVRDCGFSYKVAPSEASDHHLISAGGVKFYVLASAQGFDVRAFGAKGDGNILTNAGTDDHVAVQAAVDAAKAVGGGTVYFGGGKETTYRLSDTVRLYSNICVKSDGATVWNSRSAATDGGSNNRLAPFLVGQWALDAVGWRAKSGDPWTRKIDMYICKAVVSVEDTSVTLATPSQASKFSIGDLVYLRSQESRVQTSTGVSLELPNENSILKIVAISGGTIMFEHPIGFETATSPYLCKIRPGATSSGLPLYFVENVTIEGLNIVGQNAVGNNNTGAYNCHWRNITFDTHNFMQVNGLAHCSIMNVSGKFVERLFETKFSSHDSIICNVIAQDGGTPSALGTISIGEGARNITVDSFSVLASRKTGGQIFQLQPGRDCTFRNGTVFAPNSANNPVVFYADDNVSLERIRLENVKIIHGSSAHVVFADGRNEPIGCSIQNCQFITSKNSDNVAVSFLGGQNNEVSSNFFNSGRIIFSNGSAGNIIVGNTVDSSSVSGAGAVDNYVGANFKRDGSSVARFGDLDFMQGIRARGTGAFSTSGYGVELDSPATYGRLRAVDRGNLNALINLQIIGNNIPFITGASASTSTEAMRIDSNGYMSAAGVSMLAPDGTIALKCISAAHIASASNAINTTNKRPGLIVFDTTNKRMMIATASDAMASWVTADGVTSVTPS